MNDALAAAGAPKEACGEKLDVDPTSLNGGTNDDLHFIIIWDIREQYCIVI
jgi:hypothetical protein